MFGPQNNPASMYAKVNVDTGVSQADPHRLIDLLFQRAQDLLATADNAIATGDVATKGESLTKVIRILDEGLRAALDPSAGEIAENLHSLYTYCLNKLLVANRDSDVDAIEEVRKILAEIHDGWQAIAPGAAKPQAVAR
ncbi:MAG: flagellar export chaperone FliS [Burkholderiaceae bacterium]